MSILAMAISIEESRLRYEEELKDFLDIASHELRHPVSIMKGFSMTIQQYREAKISHG